MVSYLLFDLDNTLYSSSTGVSPLADERMCRYVASFLDVDYAKASAMREAGLRCYDHTLTWLIAEYRFSAIEAFMAYVHDMDIETLIPKNIGLKSLLESISLPKSILTNAPVEHALRILNHLNIQDQFERIFDTRFHRFKVKPNPVVYQDTIDALNLDFEQVMLIDDIKNHLLAFQRMGGAVLLIDEKGGSPHSDLQSLTEISALPGILLNDLFKPGFH